MIIVRYYRYGYKNFVVERHKLIDINVIYPFVDGIVGRMEDIVNIAQINFWVNYLLVLRIVEIVDWGIYGQGVLMRVLVDLEMADRTVPVRGILGIKRY